MSSKVQDAARHVNSSLLRPRAKCARATKANLVGCDGMGVDFSKFANRDYNFSDTDLARLPFALKQKLTV